MFLRLRASLSPLPRAADGDKDGHRRHRLSKPLTNKSSANLLILSAQQSEAQAKNSSDVDVSVASLSPTTSQKKGLEVVHSPVSESKLDTLRAKPSDLQEEIAFILGEDPVQGVASLTLLAPRGSVKAKRPLSAIFTPRFSSSRKASDLKQRRASLQALAESGADNVEKNKSLTSPCASENQSEAPRLHRRSSFTPGVATRTSRKASSKPSAEEQRPHADRDYYYNSTLSEESPLGQLEVLDFDEEWTPPAPPVARSETPSNLDYTHLGGLRLGSLRVVNGRASPVPSELSRHRTAASTPNLKRDASSEYGRNGDDGTLITPASVRLKSYRDRDQGLQESKPITRKPVPALMTTNANTPLLPKRDKSNVDTFCERVESTGAWMPGPKVDTPLPQTATSSPDRASELAMEYMAELCASPYSSERPSSPTGSVLKSTSKTTEFDDELFEDDADPFPSEEVDHPTPDIHHTSSDPVWVYEDAYSLSVKRSRDSSPRSSLQPSNSTGSSIKPDSGYGSKISLQSSKSQTREATSKTEGSASRENVSQGEAEDIEMTRGRPEPPSSAMPSRPSILKQSETTAPQLPIFPNLHPSTTTLATVKSTNGMPTNPPAKLRKLQKKSRPQSQPPPIKHILIQGQHQDISNDEVPPIPVEIAANLAIRAQQLPELGHTFSSMHHTREIESSPKPAFAQSYVDFPTADPSSRDSMNGVDFPSLPDDRSSSTKWSKSERRRSQRRASMASGISEYDARAIIHDHNTAVSSMGGSPYEIATKVLKPIASPVAESKTSNDLHSRSRDSSRPRPMMDDATAAELARLRSRTIAERDGAQWKQSRGSFNDKGGIPGRNIRPMSTAGDAPPLPPLPIREQIGQREVRRDDHQQSNPETRAMERKYWHEQPSINPYETPAPPSSHFPRPGRVRLEDDTAPPPPSHSPQPRSIELCGGAPAPPPPPPPSHSPHTRSTQSPEEVFAPPPPSHSPHPMYVGPQEEEEEVADIWAAQASAWRSRRKSLSEMLQSRTSPPEAEYTKQSFSTQDYTINEPTYPEIPLRPPPKSFTTGSEEYRTSDLQFHDAQFEQTIYAAAGRPGPYESFASDAVDRSRWRLSQVPCHAGSYTSLAEELHPPEKERPHPPPQFGGYTGGLGYDYERGAGFGGSAGTRSVSGLAQATRKGIRLSEGYGVDLGDVSIMMGIRRKPVG